jgi:hypothetical protein
LKLKLKYYLHHVRRGVARGVEPGHEDVNHIRHELLVGEGGPGGGVDHAHVARGEGVRHARIRIRIRVRVRLQLPPARADQLEAAPAQLLHV